ncbi:MAG: C4-dicarboxylate transporter, DcuC family [Bacillota bacterium]|nr:C4-dicarboxylate transporter, DcuC family [Bacillota bacterium]
MVFIGGLIVILTFVAIIKRYETRLVLFLSGLLMALISLNPLAAFDAFAKTMAHTGLVPIICSVMGFAYVAKATKCDQHLVRLLTEPLSKMRPILIPGAVIVTFIINIALTSAAGVSAAVGAILIPTLIRAGVKPEMAAAAVFAGTFGSVLSPGNAHNVYVAEMAKQDVMSVIGVHATTSVIAGLISAASLAVVAFVLKEHRGYEPKLVDSPASGVAAAEAEREPVSLIKALVPVLPLVLLILATPQIGVLPKDFSIPAAMLIGAMVAWAVTRVNPQEISKSFFDGMGYSYANVIGIIVAASVFTAGMQAIGLTGALIEAMKRSTSAVNLGATFGPFFIAVLGGSGDAATMAFNGAVTPHAAEFGLTIPRLGSMANLAGALGRTMSPVSGAAIVCASLAGVNPMELAKRTAPGMIIAAIVAMLLLL